MVEQVWSPNKLIRRQIGVLNFSQTSVGALPPHPQDLTLWCQDWNPLTAAIEEIRPQCDGAAKKLSSKQNTCKQKNQYVLLSTEFTHAAGAVRLISHPGGFIGLWQSAAGRERFPVQYLTDAGETLQEFVARGSEH